LLYPIPPPYYTFCYLSLPFFLSYSLLCDYREGRKNLRPAEEMVIKGLAVKIRPYEYISGEDAPLLIGKKNSYNKIKKSI
jgi:hypothetical protein